MGMGNLNVLVINQCAHNKGDRAVLAFVLQELARNGFESVTVSTSDRSFWRSSDIEAPLKVKFVPWGWNVELATGFAGRIARISSRLGYYPRFMYPLIRLLFRHNVKNRVHKVICNHEFRRSLDASDVVVSTGGHHVTTLLATNAVSPQLYDMALALQAQKKLKLWSQSIGPLEFSSEDDAVFVREILESTNVIYLRDFASFSELSGLGGSFNTHKTQESVLGLSLLDREYVSAVDRDPIVGISVYTVKKRSQQEYRHYVESMAALVDHILDRGLTPRFFPMAIEGSSADDRPTIKNIIATSQQGKATMVVERDLQPLAHIREVAKCQAFIGHKTHSIIFALVTATPLVAIAYHQKTFDFMEQYGLSEYCISDAELSPESINPVVDKVLLNLPNISLMERERTLEYATKVRFDFRSMLLQ